MHRVNRALSHLLVVISILWAAAGSLGAARQADGSEPGASSTNSPALDYEFFKTKVQPVFLAKRPGHARCVACHASNNAAFHLEALSPGSTAWNEEQSRKNFELIKKVVAPGSLKSPLLVHPLAEDAGGDFFHSGGKHFNSQDDPEWQILKAFVFGATVK